jgi:hypothetical protein
MLDQTEEKTYDNIINLRNYLKTKISEILSEISNYDSLNRKNKEREANGE